MPATHSAADSPYETLRRQLIAEHAPSTPTESILVDELAFAAYRMHLIQQKPDAPDVEKRYRIVEQLFHRALRALAQLRRQPAPKPKPQPPAITDQRPKRPFEKVVSIDCLKNRNRDKAEEPADDPPPIEKQKSLEVVEPDPVDGDFLDESDADAELEFLEEAA